MIKAFSNSLHSLAFQDKRKRKHHLKSSIVLWTGEVTSLTLQISMVEVHQRELLANGSQGEVFIFYFYWEFVL